MTTLAFLGCAHIHTPGFITAIKKRGNVRVKSVWDHDAERAMKRAEELGATVVGDVREICGDKDVHGVVICSETNRHQDLVLPAAKAKKNMFVEKPLGFGGADAKAMAEAIDASGVIFQTGYMQRGSPITQFIKQHIDQGSFGTITRARVSNCHSGSLGGWFDTEWRWMADPKIAGVGAFGDLGTHGLDILMWWLGDVKRVTGNVRAITKRYGDCDETGEAIIEFENGALATLAAAWVDVANPVTHLVSGTEGHAAVVNGQLFFQSKKYGNADGKTPWTDLPAASSAGFEAFLDVMTGSEAKLVSAREAAARSVVMEGIYRGARENTWVEVAR
jgi:predicted dehydrogenase